MKIPYNLIITVIILYELFYTFIKDYFNWIIIPLDGVGFKEEYSESEFLIEDKIVGGRLSVE